MSWYELLHDPVGVKGHVVATMAKPEELMSVGHLDETVERENIHNSVPLNTTPLTTTKKGL